MAFTVVEIICATAFDVDLALFSLAVSAIFSLTAVFSCVTALVSEILLSADCKAVVSTVSFLEESDVETAEVSAFLVDTYFSDETAVDELFSVIT